MAFKTSIFRTLDQPFANLGLKNSPFPVTPDASNYYISESIEQHLFEILHSIDMRKGFLLITAEVGFGKTTLSRFLIGQLPTPSYKVALMFSSFLQTNDLLNAINKDFGIEARGGVIEHLAALQSFLIEQFMAGHNCVIIIDEAQKLSSESLELIRQISNLETDTHKLVQIILIAQPELVPRLQAEDLRQVFSRLALHIELGGFSPAEIKDYISFRLKIDVKDEGGMAICIDEAAIDCLHFESNGCPRRINAIMDRSLYVLVATQQTVLTQQVVKRASDELPRQKLSRVQREKSDFIWSHAIRKNVPSVSLGLVLGLSVLLLLGFIRGDNPAAIEIEVAAAPAVVLEAEARVEKFVASYELGDLAPVVTKILTKNEFPALEQALELVLFDRGWSYIVCDLALLTPFDITYLKLEGKPQALILWQPEFSFREFANGTQSQDVFLLQKRLADLAYYAAEADGIVGSLTTLALMRYQVDKGLVATGLPDVLTLLSLSLEVTSKATTFASSVEGPVWN